MQSGKTAKPKYRNKLGGCVGIDEDERHAAQATTGRGSEKAGPDHVSAAGHAGHLTPPVGIDTGREGGGGRHDRSGLAVVALAALVAVVFFLMGAPHPASN